MPRAEDFLGMNVTANPELFVDARCVAEWLGITPRRVLEMARKRQIPAYPLGTGRRKTWRFRLSEVSAAIVTKK
jgi:helix-turn-helix protein